jgi:hypothetical protein
MIRHGILRTSSAKVKEDDSSDAHTGVEVSTAALDSTADLPAPKVGCLTRNRLPRSGWVESGLLQHSYRKIRIEAPEAVRLKLQKKFS